MTWFHTTTNGTHTVRSGSVTLSQRDLFQREMSTNEVLSTCSQTTCADTGIITSSAELADGPTLSVSLDGRTKTKYGPARARVSRFRALDSAKEMPTNDTSGPLFSALSPSAALQQSLANRLAARMDLNGSVLFALTWKELDMPSGPPICRLAASARRTSGDDCSGWPTPVASDGERAKLKLAAIIKVKENRRSHLLLGELATWLSGTDENGQLSSELIQWLMGYPEEWVKYAPTATPSSHKSRRSSSTQHEKL